MSILFCESACLGKKGQLHGQFAWYRMCADLQVLECSNHDTWGSTLIMNVCTFWTLVLNHCLSWTAIGRFCSSTVSVNVRYALYNILKLQLSSIIDLDTYDGDGRVKRAETSGIEETGEGSGEYIPPGLFLSGIGQGDSSRCTCCSHSLKCCAVKVTSFKHITCCKEVKQVLKHLLLKIIAAPCLIISPIYWP